MIVHHCVLIKDVTVQRDCPCNSVP